MDKDFVIIFFVVSNIVNFVGAFLPLEIFMSILFDAHENKIFIKAKIFNIVTIINDTATIGGDSINLEGSIKKSIKFSDLAKKPKYLFLLKAFHIPIQNIIISLGNGIKVTDSILLYGIINIAGDTLKAITSSQYSKTNISAKLNYTNKSKILYESIIATSIANIIIVTIKKVGELIWNNLGKKIKFSR